MGNDPKYVIQRHERQGQAAHWDLMLEAGEGLKTYRIDMPPEKWGNKPIEAEKIFDHDLKFLSYEGSVNKGKGKVKIEEKGTYKILEKDENMMRIELEGDNFGFRISEFGFK